MICIMIAMPVTVVCCFYILLDGGYETIKVFG